MIYTPASGGSGTNYSRLTFQLRDNGGTTNGGADIDASPNTLSFNITDVNQAPTGSPSASLASGSKDMSYTINVSDLIKGFTDGDNDVLSVSGLSASSGTLKDNKNGSWTLSPSVGFSGQVNLSYQVVDGKGGSVDAKQSFLLVAPPTLSVDAPTVTEGDGGKTNLSFTLSLSKALSKAGSVDYAVQSDTAGAGIDFTQVVSGSINFAAGELSKTITVPVLGDTLIEGDERLSLLVNGGVKGNQLAAA